MAREEKLSAKEDASPGASGAAKEFTSKAEYNRWLITQDNFAAAEAKRSQTKEGVDFVKERQRQHQTKGLARQQAAAVQMKKASESIEAHRESNLTLGRSVYEEVAGWRKGAAETKEQWSSHGKSIKETQKASNAVPQAMAAMTATKKAQAQTTRDDDAKQEKARKDLQDLYLERSKKQAERVREETADAVVDDAKRFFFEQRLKCASDTKTDAARLEKERKEEDAAFRELQRKKRVKSKSYRVAASKSKQALLTLRAEEATAMREEKKRLAETNRQRLDDEKRDRTAQVKGVQANAFLQQPPESASRTSATGEGGMPLEESFYSLTNIRPPSPTPEGMQITAA